MVKLRGFSLVELILAMALLGILTIALFEAFDYGARSFKVATSRQDSQSAVRSVYVGLRDDLRRSHFSTVTIISDAVMVDGVEVDRDAISIGSLKNWSAPSSFDEVNGLPKWDRYVLYYATDEGRLIKTLIDPDRPDYSPIPYPDLDPTRYLNEDPSLNSGYQSTYQILSQDLHEFTCEKEAATNTVEIDCLLIGDNKKKNQIKFTVFPQNTWPKGENR